MLIHYFIIATVLAGPYHIPAHSSQIGVDYSSKVECEMAKKQLDTVSNPDTAVYTCVGYPE